VTFIFTDSIKEAVQKTIKFAKNNKILVRFSAFGLVSLTTLVIGAATCGITLGYNVEYEGEHIGTVSSKSVFDDAKEYVFMNLSGTMPNDVITSPKFDLTFTKTDNLTSSKTLADDLITNTNDVAYASALKVNGEILLYAPRDELGDAIESTLRKYYVKGADNNSAFVDDIEITNAYCVEDNIKSSAEIKKAVGELKVKTVSTIVEKSEVKYTTKVVYTKEKTREYNKVTTKGKKGLKTETTVVENINGKQTASTVVSKKVIKEPVQKIITQGTAISKAEATAMAEAKSAGFIMPMNRRDIKLITAYWGDGRNHKGIDFAGNTGSPLFAAKAGKVSFAGWDGAYGYAVVVDHGNGYQTRYAHANALCVSKGDTVKQGQQVATLGNTGRSTGPHLHFEILKNGKQYNTAPYLGLKH
jgi:murein DD-endopeptidase MepM/ murein hydrolase activator NlpD